MLVSLTQMPDKIAASPRYIRALAALGCGAIMVPALPPWNFWPAMFLGFSLFYIQFSAVKNLKAAFCHGWLFGFGYFACGLSWVANALLVDGNDFMWFWPFAVAGLPALLAFFTAFACMCVFRFAKLEKFGGWLLFTAAIMGFEWLRGHIFTGFPWNLYGYTWAKALPLAQLVALGGTYWLSLLTCLWATLPGFLFLWPRKLPAKIALTGAVIISMTAGCLYGLQRLRHNPTVMRQDAVIRLVQPNIGQEEKWNPAKEAANLNKLLALSDARRVNNFAATLIIWPETAISDFILRDTGASAAIKAVLSGYDSPVYLLSGVLRYEKPENGNAKYFNSLVVFDSRLNRLASYDKSHLVPFGEYIPLQKWIPLQPFVKFEGFTQGRGPQSLPLGDLGSFSPLVCYEVIFPGAVTDKANRPEFMVNITNDSWYGDSSGPRQHFIMAQFRAIEEGLPIVRSANTGISGVIDPAGRVIYREDLSKASGNNIALPQKLENATPYSKLKDSIFGISLLVLIVFTFASQGWKRVSEQ